MTHESNENKKSETALLYLDATANTNNTTISGPQFAMTVNIERALNPTVIHASRQQLHRFMKQSAIFGPRIIE